MKDTFGLRLRYYRTSKNLTQQELANKSGVSRKQISDLENETQKNPRDQTVQKLATALDISVLNLKPDLEIPVDLDDDVKKSLLGHKIDNVVSYEIDISDLPDSVINEIESWAKEANRSFEEQFNLYVLQLLTKAYNEEKENDLNKFPKFKDAESSFKKQ